MANKSAPGRNIPGDFNPVNEDRGAVPRVSNVFGIPSDWLNDRTWLRTVADQVSDYFYVKDRNCRFVIANAAVARDMGHDSADYLIGRTDLELHAPEIGQKFYDDEQQVIATGCPKIDYEEFNCRPDGTKRWFSSSKFPLRGPDGQIVGIFGLSRDITDRKKAELLRAGQSRALEMIATGAALGEVLQTLVELIEEQLDGILGSILLLDDSGRHLLNGAAPSLPALFSKAVHGVEIGPAVGSCGTAAYRGETVIVADIMTDPLWANYKMLAEPHGLRSCWSTPILSKTGGVLGTFAMYSKTAREPGEVERRLTEETTRLAAIAIERIKAEEQIRYLAHFDVLTGLPNRHELKVKIERQMAVDPLLHPELALVFFDLDQFKSVNDGFGHAVGDEVLRIVARRILELLEMDDVVIRFGGDEFVLLIRSTGVDKAALEDLLLRIRHRIAEPIVLEDQSFHITCSMGIARAPHDAIDADTLLRHADSAMYRAKQAGRDTYRFYLPSMCTGSQSRLTLLEDMRAGLRLDQFRLDYQPQFNVRTGNIVGAEALVRWHHPQLGLLMPGQFIPLAEDTGLIVSLGNWVLAETCRQNKAWQELGLPKIVTGVNVSARQFVDAALVESVEDALVKSGLDPQYLELEITERLLIQDTRQAVSTMEALRRIGVQLAIDDFGTGFSSLSVLKTFPLTRLKIDRSFTKDLSGQTKDRNIFKAIIALGQELGLEVVAEGVETAEQLAILHDFLCETVQGYYLGRPVKPEEFERLLSLPEAPENQPDWFI